MFLFSWKILNVLKSRSVLEQIWINTSASARFCMIFVINSGHVRANPDICFLKGHNISSQLIIRSSSAGLNRGMFAELD